MFSQHTQSKRYVIGVCGASCSGKTTTCNNIIDKVIKIFGTTKDIIVVLSQDSYYFGGGDDTNYDVPSAIDFNLMIAHLKQLINGNQIDEPIYDFTSHSRKKETRPLGPALIILVEGILVFSQKELRDLFDLKIFVDAHPELMYARRLQRDITERGRTQEEVDERYFRDVRPATQMYITPMQDYSDIVLKNNVRNEFVGLQIVLDHIEKKIKQ